MVTSSPEKTVGTFRESRWSLGFWFRTIITLGLYWFLYHRFNEIVLTTRRVMQRSGNILTHKETAMSIENITDVTVNRSALGRLLSYGDIHIQSAGSNAAEISQNRCAGADKLRDAIFDLRDGRLDETSLG
jgi:membrane protein YdbS with pleckstrin-like domain